ncbi:hypothetical protein AB0F77_35685 [Streptomyces sp. NPDC026672]|uniref:hypothetical protein n=1 Tax=unclassified Streptomyces TaxID=2593676 RepID=UPI00340427C4
MGELPQWLEKWFAENEAECRARGTKVVLRLRPADGRPDRPGRKPTADAKVTAEAGSRWGNAAVYAGGWGHLMGIDDVTEVVWQADLRPDSQDEVDVIIGHLLAWVESTAEVPSWARS